MSLGTAIKMDNLIDDILRMGGELTVRGLTREQFIMLSEQYPGLRMEREKKMKDSWIANGVRLAWLIDPFEEKAYIFHADKEPETIIGFDKVLSGEDVLPGFVLELSEFKLFV